MAERAKHLTLHQVCAEMGELYIEWPAFHYSHIAKTAHIEQCSRKEKDNKKPSVQSQNSTHTYSGARGRAGVIIKAPVPRNPNLFAPP